MEEKFEKKYHEIEKSHFWFKSRRRYIRNILNRHPKDASVLDIGCSSGILLDELQRDGFKNDNLFGVDISEIAIQNCKSNGISNAYVMDAQHITLQNKFDVIIASDCLEHIQNDEDALQNWSNLLKPDGTILVFVPAFMGLWSHHDKVNMHFRRYTLNELKLKLSASKMVVQKGSYWNFFLFIPVFLVRKIEKILPSRKNDSGDLKNVPALNIVLYTLINFENWMLRFTNFPFGISTFCIAKRR